MSRPKTVREKGSDGMQSIKLQGRFVPSAEKKSPPSQNTAAWWSALVFFSTLRNCRRFLEAKVLDNGGTLGDDLL